MTDPHWAVLVGNAKTQRNEAIDLLIEQLRAADLSVGGIVQRPTDGGQNIENIATGETMALGQMNAKKADLCSWSFDDAAFAQARTWIEAQPTDVTIIPVGRLERTNKGHWAAVQAAFTRPGVVVLCISPTLLPRYMLDLPDPVAGVEAPASPADVHAFVSDLTRYLSEVS